MMPRPNTYPQQTAAEAMEIITRAALANKRCPKNRGYGDDGEEELSVHVVAQLVREGAIRVEISGQNYRRITILTGPQAGKATAPDPSGNFVWRVIDARQRRRPAA